MVTWNALEYTKLTIKSLYESTEKKFTFTIVDNNSTDGTRDYLKDIHNYYPNADINVLLKNQNLGYGGAIYSAREYFKNCNFTVILNNDLLFSKKWLEKMLEEFNKDKTLAMLGPARPLPIFEHPYINSSTDDVVNGLPLGLSIENEISGLTRGSSFDEFVKDFLAMHSNGVKYVECPPAHIGGCCFIVRNKLINKVGGIIDPKFPHGSEDIDLSWRISTNGYKLGIATNVFVHHFRHKAFNVRLKSSQKVKMDEYYKKPNLVFFEKWKKDIYDFLSREIELGVNVNKLMLDESYYNYWFLRRLNQSIGFWKDGVLVKPYPK